MPTYFECLVSKRSHLLLAAVPAWLPFLIKSARDFFTPHPVSPDDTTEYPIYKLFSKSVVLNLGLYTPSGSILRYGCSNLCAIKSSYFYNYTKCWNIFKIKILWFNHKNIIGIFRHWTAMRVSRMSKREINGNYKQNMLKANLVNAQIFFLKKIRYTRQDDIWTTEHR